MNTGEGCEMKATGNLKSSQALYFASDKLICAHALGICYPNNASVTEAKAENMKESSGKVEWAM